MYDKVIDVHWSGYCTASTYHTPLRSSNQVIGSVHLLQERLGVTLEKEVLIGCAIDIFIRDPARLRCSPIHLPLFTHERPCVCHVQDEMDCLVAGCNFLLKAIYHEAFVYENSAPNYVTIQGAPVRLHITESLLQPGNLLHGFFDGLC